MFRSQAEKASQPVLRLLLWQTAVVQRNGLLRGSWRKRIGWLAGVVLGILLAYVVFVAGVALFGWLLVFQPGTSEGLITGVFALLSAFALFWGIGSVLSELYMASDLELLLAAPIPASDIFWLKLLTAMWQNVVPALIPVTVLVAYGVAAGAGIAYFVATALVFMVMLAILAGAGMAVVILLIRVVPARRAREVYSLLYVIFFAVGWLGWMFISRGGTSRAGTARPISAIWPTGNYGQQPAGLPSCFLGQQHDAERRPERLGAGYL